MKHEGAGGGSQETTALPYLRSKQFLSPYLCLFVHGRFCRVLHPGPVHPAAQSQ